MSKLSKILVLKMMLVIGIFVSSCDNPSDSDSPPEAAEISGIVTFSGDWPTEGTVYLTINNKGAPVGAPYATTTITSADLDNSGKYEYQFKDVAFGTYGAITVSWLDPNDSNPATNQHILGGYGGSVLSGFMDSQSVTVSEEEYELKGIDISANFHVLNLINFGNIQSYTSDIPNTAWENSQEVLAANQMPSVSLELHVGPNTTLYFNDNEQAFLKAIRFWENFPQPTSYIALFYSLEDKAWAVEKYINFPHYTEGMESLIDAPCTPTSCTGANSGIEPFSSVGLGVFGIDAADSWDTYRYGPIQIHEYTHAVQASPWIGENHPGSWPNNIPSLCWLIEGQAHFAGLSVGSDSLEGYLQIRKQQVTAHTVDSFQDYSASGIIGYYEEEDCFPPNPNYSLGYTIGFLTVEVLSAIGGSESSMNLYVLMQKGETFDKAFESVYGLSWESAKPVVADVVADLIENIDET